ncbi:TetR/AcrR family transcriptional regulator [Chitinophaga ginsengisegetis]|uniref:TetR/AcrR family transcriptional regulator n=1 Tax=Chitinophaga ginsengisegetis TaxID=393003 RepID=UPI000DBA128A|nr:TetR/AcrR family transcriptional regulator [Chitinophaga ginsengisegetis]MDR6568911.1 AcrR family transcriptional regulator [Chitinophaga ginsengisegetis]MDR6649060.1 AcrR family transcriptional regulator [Chitinophaga ginsengisegetis]MDR6654992.1 AcrR family transcriptional regulator [Chitinophaga ginsengisegetis]
MNDSRELILNTSLKLFLQKSFKEVTMKEIVMETGMSKGAFYHYFSSKEQVFEEVIRFFYGDIMSVDYNSFSQNSLREFYHDYLNHVGKQMKVAKYVLGANDGNAFNSNHYLLIFDALKILPDFKAHLLERQKEELRSWVEIIKTAKKKGEIKSAMADATIARLFIFSGDGMGINYIIADTLDKTKKELQVLWDGLYTTLKP